MKLEFERLRPLGVYLASTPDIVSGQSHALTGEVVSSWGGRGGSRCVVIGRTTAAPWLHTVSNTLARGVDRLRLQWRIWVPRSIDAPHSRMQDDVERLLQLACEAWWQYPERNGVMLLRPDVDLAGMHHDTLRLAATISNQVWTDSSMRRECRERAELRASGRAR